MIDNPAGISRRIIFYREWKQVSLLSFFVRFGSLKESSGGKCRRSSLTDYNVLYGCVMFQPLFYTFHIIFTCYHCLICAYGSETGAFVAVYPSFQGTDTPCFPHLQKIVSNVPMGSPKVTIIASNVVLSGNSSKYFKEPEPSAFRPKDQS